MPAQQRLELLLPSHERKWPQVVAVQRHQIEAPNAQDLLAVVAGMEGAEIWRAVFLARHHLPIDDRTPAGQAQQRIADARKAVRKVAAILGEGEDVLAGHVGLAAVAVEYHLVQPGVAHGKSHTQGGLSRDDERRNTQHRLEYTTGDVGREVATLLDRGHCPRFLGGSSSSTRFARPQQVAVGPLLGSRPSQRGLSSGSISTQVIDQLHRSPVVPPICFLIEPTTVCPLTTTRLSLLASQQARGY